MDVIGRERELATARALLADHTPGLTSLALVGPAGIGKTVVWQLLADELQASGALVLRARPTATETLMSLTGLADLCAGLPAQAVDAVRDGCREALRAALLQDAPPLEPIDQRLVAVGLLDALEAAARTRTLVLAVDDVPWLDTPSSSLLAYALRRLDGVPVRLLTTARDEAPPDLLTPHVPDERRLLLTLGSLPERDVETLLRSRSDAAVPRSTTSAIARTSGGNPMLALQLAHAAGDAGVDGRWAPVPHDLRGVLQSRLSRLPSDTVDVLLRVSASARYTADASERVLLEPAETEGVVEMAPDGQVRFVHPLWAAVVYESASAPQRRAVHRALAAASSDPEERARHLDLAAVGADEQVAAELVEAALVASRRAALPAAAELAEAAYRRTPESDAAVRDARLFDAARYAYLAGDGAQASTLLHALTDGRDRSTVAPDALRLLAAVTFNSESFYEARPLLEAAIEVSTGDTLARGLLDLAYVRSNVGDLLGAAEAVAQAATVDGLSPTARAEVASVRVMMDYLMGLGYDREALDRAIADQGPDTGGPLARYPGCVRALIDTYVSDHDRARPALRGLYESRREQGLEAELHLLTIWLAWSCLQTGDLDDARRWNDEMARLTRITSSPTARTWVATIRAHLLVAAGDVDGARAAASLAERLAVESGYLLPLIWIVAARTELEVALGDPAAAVSASAPAVAQAEAMGIGEPVAAMTIPLAVEALAAVGQRDRAVALLDQFETRSVALDRAWCRGTAARARGVVLSLDGRLEEALAHLDDAVVQLERVQAVLDVARVELLRGRVLRRLRRKADSRQALDRAARTFEALGSRLWLEAARSELARTQTPQIPEQLTPSQRRTAELAAQGLTTREIAEQLFVSTKTVETHLTQAYRKLGVRTRAELAARLAQP